MTDDYTPSTDDVRTQYIGTTPDRVRHPHEVERWEQFDRWLESVRAEERERIARLIDQTADVSPAYSDGMRRAARIAREGA
jgi:hypothetical protein